MKKKAYFLTADAFIAVIIIIGVVVFLKPVAIHMNFEETSQEDVMKVLSVLKIGEINNSYVKQLIADGNITNLNQSVLEQIGEFYAESSPLANTLAQSILDDLDLDDNIGIYFNGQPIATKGNKDLSNASRVWTVRKIISGIQEGTSVLGYSSRAFLSSKNHIKYFYLGGYVGDGNISLDIGPDVSNIKVEAMFSDDFDVYINGFFVDSYHPAENTPFVFEISNKSLFSLGNNSLEFRGDTNLYIGGGYVKVVYSNFSYSENMKKFPGVNGFINLYDSFYVPGNLTSLEVGLHFNSSYDIFMRIGGEMIYKGNSSGDEMIVIPNSNLSSSLDYSELSQRTIPVRIGLFNITSIVNFTRNADVFSVTDLSGSMAPTCNDGGFFCCLFSGDFCGSQSTCESCSGTWEDKIGQAKEANKGFIDSVLNYSGNHVGLVGYASDAPESDYHQLSNYSVSLKNKVDGWSVGGSTCICCGVNKAVQKLINESSEDNFLSLVIMSDGQANVECSEQGTGDAKQDAIQAACDAYDNYGIKIYTVGFGEDADEQTLQDMASCGHGNYYYGSVEDLVDVYKQVAEDILNAMYIEQTVIGQGIITEIFNDSYIKFDYDWDAPYGLIITSETEAFGNNISEGSFFVPNDTTPYETSVISYSGSKWTDNVDVFNNETSSWDNVFNLSHYEMNYTELGDPFVVNIPSNRIIHGNNTIRVSTGLSPQNSTGGSVYDKIIYSLVKEAEGFSPIVSSAEGCSWHVEFEDGTNDTISVPENYSGSSECYYTSSSKTYNPNDAIDLAIYNLFSSIDLNHNGKIETKFSDEDLSISSTEISGIPFTWETEAQIRLWK